MARMDVFGTQLHKWENLLEHPLYIQHTRGYLEGTDNFLLPILCDCNAFYQLFHCKQDLFLNPSTDGTKWSWTIILAFWLVTDLLLERHLGDAVGLVG